MARNGEKEPKYYTLHGAVLAAELQVKSSRVEAEAPSEKTGARSIQCRIFLYEQNRRRSKAKGKTLSVFDSATGEIIPHLGLG